MASYDPDNVFAKILRGELPSHRVYEDDRSFAFLDIMPRAAGHTLVIPKAPARNLLDVDPDDLAHLAGIVQKVARAGMKVFNADGVTVHQFSEAAGGQVVLPYACPRDSPPQRRRAQARGELSRRAGGAVRPGAQARRRPAVTARPEQLPRPVGIATAHCGARRLLPGSAHANQGSNRAFRCASRRKISKPRRPTS